MLAAIILALALFLAVPGQAFVPEIQMLSNASIPLVPLLVFYVATIYPLPIALLAAAFAGVFWDALWGGLMPEGLTTPLGWTMLLLGVPCMAYHLATFERRRRGILAYCIICFSGVLAMQIADFLWVELHTEAFKNVNIPESDAARARAASFLHPSIYQRMLWTSVLALLSAPFIYLAFGFLGARQAGVRGEHSSTGFLGVENS